MPWTQGASSAAGQAPLSAMPNATEAEVEFLSEIFK